MVVGSFLTPMTTLTIRPVTVALARALTSRVTQKPSFTTSSVPETLTTGEPRVKPPMERTKTVTVPTVGSVGVPSGVGHVASQIFRSGRLIPSPVGRHNVVLRVGVRELA